MSGEQPYFEEGMEDSQNLESDDNGHEEEGDDRRDTCHVFDVVQSQDSGFGALQGGNLDFSNPQTIKHLQRMFEMASSGAKGEGPSMGSDTETIVMNSEKLNKREHRGNKNVVP